MNFILATLFLVMMYVSGTEIRQLKEENKNLRDEKCGVVGPIGNAASSLTDDKVSF